MKGQAAGRFLMLALMLIAAPAYADWPVDDAVLPGGPGAETVQGTCLVCHSASMILNQPPLKRAVWEAEVAKMRGVYKAVVADGDVKEIVDYLVRVKGAE